jgi:hypothetical protein
MGLPIEIVLGNPLEHLARARHFAVELWKYRFNGVHGVPFGSGKHQTPLAAIPFVLSYTRKTLAPQAESPGLLTQGLVPENSRAGEKFRGPLTLL